MAEFTGERLIPGEVDVDLLNEHMARYAFAARLARGKRVLDAGCGAGYGSAELARAALRVVAFDLAPEAVDFARSRYAAPNLRFNRASCDALPFRDGCFDLVVSFEVIEHIPNWREFLLEVRRVLAPSGQFIVSTPNKSYYTESRGADGANPFHVHEFEFEEFRSELAQVFPHVAMFLENHVEGVSFQPYPNSATAEVRVDSSSADPAESHFFLAVCAHRPQLGGPTFIYVPTAANVLRERERHIALLEGELATKDEWLAKAQAGLATLDGEHKKVLSELERSNQWAAELTQEVEQRRTRVEALQGELATEQERARQALATLEADRAAKIEWARKLDAELKKQTADLATAVEVLHRTEKDLEERTAWALSLQHRIDTCKASRWYRLGRKLGLRLVLPD